MILFKINEIFETYFRLFRLYLHSHLKLNIMKFIEEIKRPSKQEQRTAMESYDALASMLKELETENPEIEIETITF